MDSGLNHTINILGVPVGTQTSGMLIQFIADCIDHGDRSIIAYINIHAINQAIKYPWYREFLNKASRTYCDGYGVKLGASILGHHIPERYTAPDWLPDLASTCAHKGYTMYFLGAEPGVAERAAQSLSRLEPGLQVIDTHHGYFDTAYNCPENTAVIQLLNDREIDILVLGLGTPLQEKWLLENWDRLSCRVALPVGAAFDYLAGTAWRAPRWMTDHGFEWLGRLLVNPLRFWRRYLLGIPKFFYHLFRQRSGYYTE